MTLQDELEPLTDSGPKVYGAPEEEAKRLEALARYDLMDTAREEAFDRLTRLASKIFRVPMSTVTLIDGHRQWFKAKEGMSCSETPRGPAFCNLAIRQSEPLVIEDAATDPRFSDNPFVVGDPGIRFYAGVPLASPEGVNVGTLCVMDREPRSFDEHDRSMLSDLAQMVVTELDLRLLADTDALTGAMSRRAFREEAARALSLAHRHRHDLSMIVLDLDHFKKINDTHGHSTGDRVLKGVVESCVSQLRTSDLIGRLGGEEFGILLPHTGSSAGFEVAERLMSALATPEYEANGVTFRVTASLGVASLAQSMADIDTLIEHADKALYEAKVTGRDRCVLAKPPELQPGGPRQRVFKGGRIVFNKGMSSLDCTIRSQSKSGAGLDVSSAAGVPHRFDLLIEADRVIRPCHVIALSERRIEVEFA